MATTRDGESGDENAIGAAALVKKATSRVSIYTYRRSDASCIPVF